MKSKKPTIIVLIAVGSLLLVLTVMALFSGEAGQKTLPFLCLLLAVVSYMLYQFYRSCRRPDTLLARAEQAYAAYLVGVFEDRPKCRRALLVLLADIMRGEQPAADVKRLAALSREAATPRERAVLAFFTARALGADGRGDEAVAAYEEALRHDPDFSSAWSNLGVLYQTRRNYQKAEECLTRALTLDPDSAVKHNNLANLYLLLDKPEKAREEAKRALAGNDRMVEAYLVLALAAARERKKAEAKRYAAKCTSLGMDEKSVDRLVSALLRGDISVLQPTEAGAGNTAPKKSRRK